MYDVSTTFGFFDSPLLVTVTIQLILFLSSAFWGPPSPSPSGRHIWKPPNHYNTFRLCLK